MTVANPTKPKTTIWTCQCGKKIPVGEKTLEGLKTGEVRVCGCEVVR